MSSSSYSSQMEQPQSPSRRIDELWQTIQETKNLNLRSRITSEHKQTYLKRSPKQQYSPEPLKVSSRKVEKQLTKAKENITHLIQKINQLNDQVEYLQEENHKSRIQKQDSVQKLKQEYELKLKRKAKKQKENMNSNQQYKIDEFAKQLDRMELKVRSLEMQNNNKNSQIRQLQEVIERLEGRNQNRNDSQLLNFNSEKFKGCQLLELDEANKTIQRLISLLKTTEKYRSLSTHLQSVKNGHFLSEIPKKMKSNKLSHQPKRLCNCSEIKIDEKLLWSPATCYKMMLQMKIKYDYLNEDCIEEVLFEFNRIYLAKEDTRVKKVKEFYEGELGKIKRKMDEGYSEVLAKKQITRLKKQIKNKSTIKRQSGLNDFKNVGQYEDELKLKTREVKLLQERIRLFETQNSNMDKALYYEGALWLMDKILCELQQNEADIKEFEYRFRQKLDDGEHMGTEDWLKVYKEFFEDLWMIGNGTVQKVLAMKENVLGKMGASNLVSAKKQSV